MRAGGGGEEAGKSPGRALGVGVWNVRGREALRCHFPGLSLFFLICKVKRYLALPTSYLHTHCVLIMCSTQHKCSKCTLQSPVNTKDHTEVLQR